MIQLDRQKMNIMNEQHILDAMQVTTDMAKQFGFSTHHQLLLTLATEESLMNACEHSTHVEIEWIADDSQLDIFVKQIGPLFSLDISSDVNTASRGRGLQLILHIMDAVTVEQQENGYIALKMTKTLPSPQ